MTTAIRYEDNRIHFLGKEVSSYAQEHNSVDYATLASRFDCILNNSIYSQGWDIGYGWEQLSGFNPDYTEEKEELQDKIDELQNILDDMEHGTTDTDIENQIEELQEKIQELEYEEDEDPEIYQFYIVDNNGAEILQDIDQIVYYHEGLDVYLWGVTHWGTSWDYVLTDIPVKNVKDYYNSLH